MLPADFLIFLLCALAILDVAITSRILGLGGSELFAPMRWAQATFDHGWGVLKYGLTAYAAISWAERPAMLWVAVVVMAVIVARNWSIWRRMRRS